MNQSINYILPILSKANLNHDDELLIIKNSNLIFVTIERLLISLSNLTKKQHRILKLKMLKIQDDKASLLNLMHDLAISMLSVKL